MLGGCKLKGSSCCCVLIGSRVNIIICIYLIPFDTVLLPFLLALVGTSVQHLTMTSCKYDKTASFNKYRYFAVIL